MIKSASEKFDDEFNQILSGKVDYKNQISFCSKFLHFHAPYNIFIIDRFSLEGGRLLCSALTHKNAVLQNCDTVIDDTIRKNINTYCTQFSISVEDIDPEAGNDVKKAVKYYIEHCMYSYGFGCFLRDKLEVSPESALCSFLRMVDSIFQRVKEEK